MKMAVSVTIDQDWHSELICYQYLGGQKIKKLIKKKNKTDSWGQIEWPVRWIPVRISAS